MRDSDINRKIEIATKYTINPAPTDVKITPNDPTNIRIPDTILEPLIFRIYFMIKSIPKISIESAKNDKVISCFKNPELNLNILNPNNVAAVNLQYSNIDSAEIE